MKIFVIIDRGCATIYSDTAAKIELEIIDLDSLDEEDAKRSEQRAQEVMATYVEAG